MNLEILVIPLLLLVALVFSPLGLGGGVLYVPILHYMGGWPLIESLLASLALVWMVALGSSLAHSGEGHADRSIAKTGRITAVPAAVVGTIIAWILIEYVSEIIIKIIASLILIFVIERNLRSTESVSRAEDLSTYRVGTACGGFASGLLGIGGGAIYVTLNRRLAGLVPRTAAGTSYLIGAAVVPVALLSHIIIDGTLPSVLDRTGILVALLVPLAAFAAAFGGARTAIKHLPVNVVLATFIVAVSASLGRYLWDIISQLA